eukprot:augustus_masked-scaffold_10-processed-gene-8.1-mRNA-1 protein AED:1.00 eAED:1.00 QI:0/-1/0/0/-1/1/1/0/554
MKKSLLVLICAVASAYAVSERVKNVRENLGSNRIVEVSLGSEHHKLLAEYGSDQLQVNTDRSTTTFKVGEEELELLSKFGQEFEDMTEEFIQLHEDRFNGLHEDFRFCTEGAACAKRKAEDFYAEYQPLESLWERMEDIVEESCIAKIDSVGESYEGRDQKTIVIENKGGKKKKPLVFYFCNIHAREWLTPMYCMHMAETLLTGGISGEPHYLTVIYDFTILVSANPDGYKFSWTDDNMWRKTRMPNNGTDCVGTDPNRNWDFVFGGTDSSSDPCSNTYCGVEPFDQPEVANIAAYVKKNQHRLINVNDVHSPFTCWFSPYSGYRDTPPQKDYDLQMMCAEAAIDAIEDVSGKRWRYGPVNGISYIATGGSLDWIYQEAGVIYSYLPELRGPGFQPNSTNIALSNAEMFAGMEASLKCIARQELGIAFSEDNKNPTPPPTSYPTNGCRDLVPSGIRYGDGSPAPCPVNVDFCYDDYISSVCPVTCNSCSKDYQNFSTSNSSLSSGYVLDIKKPKKDEGYRFYVVIFGFVGLISASVVIMLVQKLKRSQEITSTW